MSVFYFIFFILLILVCLVCKYISSCYGKSAVQGRFWDTSASCSYSHLDLNNEKDDLKGAMYKNLSWINQRFSCPSTVHGP